MFRILQDNIYDVTLMTDMSKVFDSLNHELFIIKLDACGFDLKSVRLIQ